MIDNTILIAKNKGADQPVLEPSSYNPFVFAYAVRSIARQLI